jgi:hypothetical protein
VDLQPFALSPVRINEELKKKWWLRPRKPRLTVVENSHADHPTPLYLQIWHKNSPISGSRSVGLVRLQTKSQGDFYVHINNVQLPQGNVPYLGLLLDGRLTWRKQIFAKRNRVGKVHSKIYWLLERSSKLSTSNKILIHKAILKPISNYGI